jgi:hypothetical protein
VVPIHMKRQPGAGPGFLAWLLLLAGSGVARAQWAPPTPEQAARLDRALATWDAQFDPAEQMVRRPFSSPGYHTKLTGGFVHPTRDSLNYALGLLDTGKPEKLARAVAILRRVIALQDADPKSRTYGIWSWFLEEPLPAMSPPDWNWADFNGVTLLQVSRDHRSRLPSDLADSVDRAILHACGAIKNRNVGPSYTNIAIMGTYVTLVAGEHLKVPEYLDYGLNRLAGIHAYTRENGTFEEYNSPTYTVVALLELSRLKAHVRDASAQPMIEDLLRRAWEEFATHFHSPTRQWAGPHSRAYSSLTAPGTLALVQRATGGRVDFGVDLPDREELRLPVACPADFEPYFRTLAAPRTVTETFIRRSNTVGRTYLHPQYALATVNQGDLWNQRRALLLHFGSAARPGYLHLRFLKDGYDFASAWLKSAQSEGAAVGIVNLVTDGGDTHISLDMVKNARIRARDLRLRFEIGGDAAAGVGIAAGSDERRFLVKTDALSMAVDVVHARLGEREGSVISGGDDAHKWIDVVLHEGTEREFDLAALQEAAVGFVVSIGQSPQPVTQVERGQLTVRGGALEVTAPVKPGPRPFGDYHAPRPNVDRR